MLLQFVPSSSRDVIRHALLRRTSDDLPWTEIAQWDAYPPAGLFEDRNIEPGQHYTYTLVAFDEKGLSSIILAEKQVTTRMIRSIDRLRPELITEPDGVAMIRWQPDATVTALKVYMKPKTTWKLVEEIETTAGAYQLPSYAGAPIMVKAVFPDGSTSAGMILTH